MNKLIPVERLVRLIVFLLCALAYLGGLFAIFQCLENRQEQSIRSVKALKLSFAQIELQAAPQPDPVPEPEQEPEVVSEEDVDVVLEEVVEKSEPEPKTEFELQVESEAPVAQVMQEAAAEQLEVEPDLAGLGEWIAEQIETEKFYPPAIDRLGIGGRVDYTVTIDTDGTVVSVAVQNDRGHQILRRAMENILHKLIGRSYGEPIGTSIEFRGEFEFER